MRPLQAAPSRLYNCVACTYYVGGEAMAGLVPLERSPLKTAHCHRCARRWFACNPHTSILRSPDAQVTATKPALAA